MGSEIIMLNLNNSSNLSIQLIQIGTNLSCFLGTQEFVMYLLVVEHDGRTLGLNKVKDDYTKQM
jgi:hypothetical protein